jgi:hypothetical protein
MQDPQQPSSGDGKAFDLSSADITSIYGNICSEFGRVEQSRQGMLQYVFAVTSLLGTASVFAGAITNNSVFQNFLTAVGVLGMISIFALFIREVQLNIELDRLVDNGKLYEQKMRVDPTMFHRSRLSAPSTALIYSAAIDGWFCVATWFAFPPGIALILAFPVFLIIGGLNWFLRSILFNLVNPKTHPSMVAAR